MTPSTETRRILELVADAAEKAQDRNDGYVYAASFSKLLREAARSASGGVKIPYDAEKQKHCWVTKHYWVWDGNGTVCKICGQFARDENLAAPAPAETTAAELNEILTKTAAAMGHRVRGGLAYWETAERLLRVANLARNVRAKIQQLAGATGSIAYYHRDLFEALRFLDGHAPETPGQPVSEPARANIGFERYGDTEDAGRATPPDAAQGKPNPTLAYIRDNREALVAAAYSASSTPTTTGESGLRECPLCRGEAEVVDRAPAPLRTITAIHCSECGLTLDDSQVPSDQVLETWNTRSTPRAIEGDAWAEAIEAAAHWHDAQSVEHTARNGAGGSEWDKQMDQRDAAMHQYYARQIRALTRHSTATQADGGTK